MNGLPLNLKLNKKYTIEKQLKETDFSNIYVVNFENNNYIAKECFPAQFVIRDKNNEVFTNKNIKKFKKIINTFRKEAETISVFNHENIIKILDYFEEKGTAFIILEYCKGKTLKEYIMNTEISQTHIMEIFLKIIEILKEIHGKSIIHRDIKPSNIIIDKSENLKFIDFGASIKKNEKNGTYLKFTQGYSPIEMYSLKSENDERTDIYSLSALLYFMINKIKPGNSISRFYNPELHYVGEVSENIKKFIERGMAFEMRERYRNIKEMEIEFKKMYNM